MPKELTAISLFSGGGGLDLGIAQAGFRTRVAVEWDRYACDTLRRAQAVKHEVSPGHAYLDGSSIVQADIRGLSAEEILEVARLEPGEASLLVGGPPCVTFSVGGLRKGLQHETGQLYEEYVRVLRHAQPSAFIFENVKGLLTAPGESGEAGGAFAAILRELEASGYALTWRLVDAADYGVPQHRHRVFVVGRRGSDPLGFPQATHARVDRVGMFGPLGFEEPWRTVQDAIADLPSAVKPGETPELANHITRSYSVEVIESFAATPPGKRNPKYKRDRLKWDEPAKAVRAQGKWKSNGSGQKNSSHQSLHPEEHRQLTVRESARIQTFPDWYEFDPTFVNGYRVVGDAVPPLLARVIAASIREQMFADAAPEKAADEPLAIAG